MLNIYALNSGEPSFIKSILVKLKMQIITNTIIEGDFNTPLYPIDRSSGQSKQKISELNDTLHQMDLTDSYMIFYPNVKGYTFYSTTYGRFSQIYHMLWHK